MTDTVWIPLQRTLHGQPYHWELHATPEMTVRDDVFPRLGLSPDTAVHMMYFTMNETNKRFFPLHP